MTDSSTSQLKQYSSEQEKTIAKYLGWRVVSGSGSRSLYPGDVVSEYWLGECKTHVTPNHSITFNHNVWKKIQKEAAAKFKYPVLFVDDGSQLLQKTWCLFSRDVLMYSDLVQDYPYSIRTNISFKHDSLLEKASRINTLWAANFHDDKVCICHFFTFAAFLNAGNNLDELH